MTSKTVIVETEVEITYDESKFTESFMEQFNEHFHQKDTVSEHVEYIAKCYANGSIDDYKPFLEGYGDLEDFGVKLEIVGTESDIINY